MITPNPTGSTGYGQRFCDAIKKSWGGLPYEDLVAGFEYIKSNLSYVDTDRAVALGASYGGYMMNWMQGHALGREFKALVCHDGVFSMANQMSSDEQYFPNHDMGGTYYQAMESWQKWDPSRFVGQWKTPMLVSVFLHPFGPPFSGAVQSQRDHTFTKPSSKKLQNFHHICLQVGYIFTSEYPMLKVGNFRR